MPKVTQQVQAHSLVSMNLDQSKGGMPSVNELIDGKGKASLIVNLPNVTLLKKLTTSVGSMLEKLKPIAAVVAENVGDTYPLVNNKFDHKTVWRRTFGGTPTELINAGFVSAEAAKLVGDNIRKMASRHFNVLTGKRLAEGEIAPKPPKTIHQSTTPSDAEGIQLENVSAETALATIVGLLDKVNLAGLESLLTEIQSRVDGAAPY